MTKSEADTLNALDAALALHRSDKAAESEESTLLRAEEILTKWRTQLPPIDANAPVAYDCNDD